MSKVNTEKQSRKWLLTINNPLKKGYTHERIKKELEHIKPIVYWCMSDEIGEDKTPHTHVYLACSSAVRFRTLKDRFWVARLDSANGTSQQNRDYVYKEGKWKTDKKGETNLRHTHEEYGQMPVERPGKRNDIDGLYDLIKQGKSDYEILEENHKHMFSLDKIGRTRQVIIEEKYKDTFRKLEVTYVYGQTGSGKTRGILDYYGYENVYRVTNYDHPFDGYKGQDVIVFEEFRSNLKISDMLNYLDGYPLSLPCRYADKIACYTKVFIVSNIGIEEQYINVQEEQSATWDAFIRRINKITEYSNLGLTEYSTDDYFPKLRVVNIPKLIKINRK